MKHILLFSLLTILSLPMNADIIRFGETSGLPQRAVAASSTDEPPYIYDVDISPDSTSATFQFKIPFINIQPDRDLYPGTYWWQLPDFYPANVAGKPALPQRTLVFEVTKDAENIALTELDTRWQSYNATPTPARPPLLIEPGAGHSLENVPPITIFSDLKKPVATISGISDDRDCKRVYVHLEPFKYIAEGTPVEACYDFRYTLSYERPEQTNAPQRLPPGFTIVPHIKVDSLTISGPFNPYIGPIRHWFDCEKHRRPAGYLIITTPDNYAAMKEYGEWKKMLGHQVQIISTEQWTEDLINVTIKSCWENDPDLRYVLFAGRIEDIPAAKRNFSNSGQPTTDFPYASVSVDPHTQYAYLAGNDVYTGRLLVDNCDEMPVILNKLRNFYTIGADIPSFHKNAAHVSFYDVTAFTGLPIDSESMLMIKTSEDVRNHLIANGKNITRIYSKDKTAYPTYWDASTGNKTLLPDDLRWPNFPWDGDSTDVERAFWEGNHYILYEGHGAPSRWDNPSLWAKDIKKLDNSKTLPFVFSITCNTGNFYEPYGLAKTLLKSKNGASSIIASTVVMQNEEAAATTLGMFRTIWPNPKYDTNTVSINEPIHLDPFSTHLIYDKKRGRIVPEEWYTLAHILDQGTQYMRYLYDNNPNDTTQYGIISSKEKLHIYGDPGLMFNTETPTEIENVHFTLEPTNMIVTPRIDAQAMVTISLDSCAIIGYYNETTKTVTRYYTDYMNRLLSLNDKFHIVITRHNKIPLEFHVENGIVTASGPYIDLSPDSDNAPQMFIRQVTQKSSDTVEVEYQFSESVTAEYSGEIQIKDLSNNILASGNVSEERGSISLSSSKLSQGIYVISMTSTTSKPIYKKILIK